MSEHEAWDGTPDAVRPVALAWVQAWHDWLTLSKKETALSGPSTSY